MNQKKYIKNVIIVIFINTIIWEIQMLHLIMIQINDPKPDYKLGIYHHNYRMKSWMNLLTNILFQ